MAAFPLLAALAGLAAVAFLAKRKDDESSVSARVGVREGETPSLDLSVKVPSKTTAAKKTAKGTSPTIENLPVRSPGIVEKPTKTIPTDLQTRMAQAIRDEDFKALEAMAGELERLGFASQASELRKFVRVNREAQRDKQKAESEVSTVLREAAVKVGLPPPPVVLPPAPLPPPPPEPEPDFEEDAEPPVVDEPAPPAEDPVDSLAQEVTDHLKGTTRYKENRNLVKEYQLQAGLDDPDGMYGPGTGVSILNRGILPVVPFYWSSTPSKAQSQKNMYKEAVSESGMLAGAALTSYLRKVDAS